MLDSRKRDIRIEAAEFRRKCKGCRYGIIDLFKECESLGIKVVRYPLGEGGDLGFVIKRDNDYVIFTNTSVRLSREIFTLAHEIGHMVLHMNIEDSFVDTGITLSECDGNEIEKEANYFAANLLMPGEEVGKFLDIEIHSEPGDELSAMDIARIMSEFNVSFDTVLNRLINLGFIDEHMKIRLDSEKNKMRVENLLNSVGGNSRLNHAGNELYLPCEYLDNVIFNYNHNAIPQKTLERALAYYRLSMEDIGDRIDEKRKKLETECDKADGGYDS